MHARKMGQDLKASADLAKGQDLRRGKDLTPAQDLKPSKDPSNSKDPNPRADLKTRQDLTSGLDLKRSKDLTAGKDLESSADLKLAKDLMAGKDLEARQDLRSSQDLKRSADLTPAQDLKPAKDLTGSADLAKGQDLRRSVDLKLGKDLTVGKDLKAHRDLRSGQDPKPRTDPTHAKDPTPGADLTPAQDLKSSKDPQPQIKLWQKILRALTRAWEFYKADTTFEEAAGLSFYTIFAIIPTLAIAISVAVRVDSFAPFLKRLNDFLVANFLPVNQEIISSYINGLLENSARVGLMGAGFVLFSAVMFFSSYEYIINKIYNTKIKSYALSVVIYFSLTAAFLPALVFSFYISDEFTSILSRFSLTRGLEVAWFLPYLVFWLLFYISYKISPSKRVKPSAALVSSLLSSLTWILAKNLFVYYAFYNKNYVSLYGQLSILMLFMLWIYISWIIFIYGLKFCKFLDAR
ncbi:MAG: YihY family inner membrane protein [Helicobacteraceae bacterium]